MRISGIAGRLGLALALLLAGWAMAPAAAEADGLYLRAGAGLERPGGTVFTDRDCSSESPAALYGCGRGGDGAPLRSTGDFAAAPALELGLGYAVSSALRLEAVAEYRPRLEFSGRANFLEPGRLQSVAVELSSLSGMLAAYLDLAESGLPRLGRFAPFVGAGAGVARTRAGGTRMTFPRTTTLVPGGRRSGFAWMLEAGVSTALGERATIDIAWRYTDLGEVRTGRGAGQVVWRDASREPLPLDLAETRARLTAHGLRLSLRYSF